MTPRSCRIGADRRARWHCSTVRGRVSQPDGYVGPAPIMTVDGGAERAPANSGVPKFTRPMRSPELCGTVSVISAHGIAIGKFIAASGARPSGHPRSGVNRPEIQARSTYFFLRSPQAWAQHVVDVLGSCRGRRTRQGRYLARPVFRAGGKSSPFFFLCMLRVKGCSGWRSPVSESYFRQISDTFGLRAFDTEDVAQDRAILKAIGLPCQTEKNHASTGNTRRSAAASRIP